MTNFLKTIAQTMFPPLEVEMRTVLNATRAIPNQFDGMIHYHMGWADEQFQPATVSAGKRIRPLLCLLCCEAAGGDWQQAVPAAASIEILHNFTLVHDDIQDKSPTRRGRSTVWTIWGIELGINVGDTMFAQAHLALNRLIDQGIDAGRVVHALRRLDEMCLELTAGQHADITFEHRDDVTTEEYIAMIDGKTAALLAFSAEMGALVAGKNDTIQQHYAQFARNLGIAFQIRDDILGIWGDEEMIGKSAATDIETKKKSLPVLYGLEKSAALRDLYHQEPSPPDFVARTVQLLDEVGARTYTEHLEQEYTKVALTHLEKTNYEGDNLKHLTQFLLGRQA